MKKTKRRKMVSQNKTKVMKISVADPLKIIYLIIAIFTSMVGYEIHHNVFYAIINFIFWPISWIYWLVCHDVNISVIKSAFGFFLT